MTDPSEAVAAAHRDHWATVLAATVGVTRDLDRAEDAVQDAYAQALTAWAGGRVPANPGGWLVTTARRRALDVIRREQTLQRKLPMLVWEEEVPASDARTDDDRVADENTPVVVDQQLRLVFLAAHPALSAEARVALTLRLVGGLTTAQIAQVFLVPEPTMAARLTRAKKRIALSRVPCRVPAAEELDERLVVVLDVVSVLLAVGQTSADPGRGPGANSDRPVLEAARRLLEVLVDLLPQHTEPRGLLAQALVLGARESTRRDDEGRPVPLAEQDRGSWDRTAIERADRLITGALRAGGRGPYLIQGAITTAVAVPERHEDVDWAEVIELYDLLLGHWPTALVRLGRGVAIGEKDGPTAALAQIDSLGHDLERHRQFHIIRGHLLSRVGEHRAASEAYRTALAMSPDDEDDLLRELAHDASGRAPTTIVG